ncbi:type IX secretion system membrane protein PorP/SprF [Flavobacterium sp. WW92]|uniref:PorP/SprF family type IX secretion system membrane protein n=1 Tax=unclassified Flavobacterium TaxID=196869 RepID=UPI002223FF14|nr:MULTISPECIES: type IX secretion system membrane protein PorP/SprF [unclassified Flavobacterium]WDO14451.1 type IX secretion system membrane protein PorP/SprF [Flavobacterium sp. WW92]
MKTLYKLNAVLLFFFAAFAYGQQETNFTIYRNNMNIINPAYAGADGESIISSSFKSQWAGVKDAPETQAVSFGTPTGKRLGIGLSVINDKTFVEKQTSVFADFSYLIPMNETLDLYLGVKAGGNFYDVNVNGLQTYNVSPDPSLVNISRFNPNFGIGAYLKHEKYYISLSSPKMLSTQRAKNKDGVATVASDRPHIYLSGGYDIKLNENFMLKPSTLLRYVNGAPTSLDITGVLNYKKQFELGAAYRTDKAISGLATIKVNNWLDFGYAYEHSLRDEIASVTNGTHEFYLRFNLTPKAN